MRIISWNVNGIRAVERKENLEQFLDTYHPDVFLMQETKAKESQLTAIIEKYDGYEQFYNEAEKAGYSGTSVWVKKSLGATDIVFSRAMPEDSTDNEGRIVRADMTVQGKKLSVLGVYFPNGGKSEQAWDDKLVFYEQFLNYVEEIEAEGRICIWGGDVNCAHNEIDLARPETNRKSIGFLPEERAWVTKCIDYNWSDVFRSIYPEKVKYSWWHVISRARLRNVGWRIDYLFIKKHRLSRRHNTSKNGNKFLLNRGRTLLHSS